MNNGALIAIGLGAVAAAVIIATSKKKPAPATTFNPNIIRSTSPGQPPFNVNMGLIDAFGQPMSAQPKQGV